MQKNKISSFFSNPRTVYLIGLVLGLAATCIELSRGRAENLMIFRDSTSMFWNGVSAYTSDFVEQHRRFFLYSPVFNVLFTPFAFLPRWMSGIIWNIGNYTLLFLAVRNLPGHLRDHSTQTALYLVLIIVESLFCFQYNMVVCYLFLWAFILLENNRPFWAVLLIMISATTKIYGIVELGLLFCYPKTWRNFCYAAICGAGLLMLPVIMTGFDGLIPWYGQWFDALTSHSDSTGPYMSIVFAIPVLLNCVRPLQIAVMLLLMVMFFCLKKRWGDLNFRIQALGVLMGYIILFSDASEPHTYVIALAGYMMCWYTWKKHTLFDKIILWSVFVLTSVVTTDVLCPSRIHQFLNYKLYLGVFAFTIAWITMVWRTIKSDVECIDNQNITK